MKKQRDLERLLVDNPAEFTRKGLGVLRSRALTGSADSALALRALAALADPEGMAKARGNARARGKLLYDLARYLKRSILAVKAGTNDWYDPILRGRILDLPSRPSLGFDLWFEVAWELYMASLDGNLENDPPMWELACKAVAKGATSKGHGEKPDVNLKKRLKVAARGCW
jgi:hypothetical protein